MRVQDRIKEFKRVKAKELAPSAKNWRTHPLAQADAMRGMLAEVGYASALIVREVDGGYEIIDGHLRAELTPEMEVPVLVVDVDDKEADKLLALMDPLAGMAESNENALNYLREVVETDNEALMNLLKGIDSVPLIEPPADFPEVDESLPTEFECPKCHYRWSGRPATNG
jgi:hypothetical protein